MLTKIPGNIGHVPQSLTSHISYRLENKHDANAVTAKQNFIEIGLKRRETINSKKLRKFLVYALTVQILIFHKFLLIFTGTTQGLHSIHTTDYNFPHILQQF